MIVLTFTIYLGGLYISNIETEFDLSLERVDNIIFVMPYPEDKNCEDFNRAIEMLGQEKGITLIQQGVISDIFTTSIMDIDISINLLSFRNEEDFKTYCEFAGINVKELCEEGKLCDGSVIMSELQAKNRGIKLGDKLVAKDDDEWINQEYTLNAITDEKGYSVYYISDTDNMNYIILPTSMNSKEYNNLVTKLKSEYNVRVLNGDYYREQIHGQLSSLKNIYFFVIILVSVVMAVTINAAFTGMYQHRQGEFALYKAMGISRRKIRLKIILEVLLMDILGLVLGLCILMLGIYLFNHLYLLEHGLQLFYYNKMSLVGMVICNLIVLIPVTISQSIKLMKADICDY